MKEINKGDCRWCKNYVVGEVFIVNKKQFIKIEEKGKN